MDQKDTREKKSTNQLLAKIPGRPGLYRHSVNGVYYGKKKFAGKRKEHSLGTNDRALAERRLKQWLADLEASDPALEKTTLGTLLETFLSIRSKKGDGTVRTERSIAKQLRETWPGGLDQKISSVKVSDLKQWLTSRNFAPANHNRYCLFLSQLFRLAVQDRIIARSPMDDVTERRRIVRAKPQVPTEQEFLNLVADIRAQKFNADSEDSADFVEFLGRAALGQAEVARVVWGDVDFECGQIAVRRRKTGVPFTVPMYPDLKPLLERLRVKAGEQVEPTAKVLKILDAKKALKAACKRLNLPSFSQRTLRQMKITALLRAGVNPKSAAQWQGHSDGGRLIIQRYSEVISGNDAEFRQAELAKYAGSLTR